MSDCLAADLQHPPALSRRIENFKYVSDINETPIRMRKKTYLARIIRDTLGRLLIHSGRIRRMPDAASAAIISKNSERWKDGADWPFATGDEDEDTRESARASAGRRLLTLSVNPAKLTGSDPATRRGRVQVFYRGRTF
jgi:hypothetical protein